MGPGTLVPRRAEGRLQPLMMPWVCSETSSVLLEKTDFSTHRFVGFTYWLTDAVKLITAFQVESVLDIENVSKHGFTDAREQG